MMNFYPVERITARMNVSLPDANAIGHVITQCDECGWGKGDELLESIALHVEGGVPLLSVLFGMLVAALPMIITHAQQKLSDDVPSR